MFDQDPVPFIIDRPRSMSSLVRSTSCFLVADTMRSLTAISSRSYCEPRSVIAASVSAERPSILPASSNIFWVAVVL